MDNQSLSGSCFCGAVTYTMTAQPLVVHGCHCTYCQIQTGGPFAINAVIETDNLELTRGKPEGISMQTDDGRPHHIYRCPECQTALWSDYSFGYLRFVRVSTLNRPHDIKPDVHIYTRTKVPWLDLPDQTTAVDDYYELHEVWSAASLERLEAAKIRYGKTAP